jgi:hypothetical protein
VSTLKRARFVVVTALATALGSVVTGCAGGGALEATLEAPPVEISAGDARKELRFRAEAVTSSPVLGGGVAVVVDPASADGTGQVRVTVYRGPDAVADPAPAGDVVPCAAEEPVEVPREALTSCDGEGGCVERFVVVFAAEGLADEPVEMPVNVQAHLVYELASEAPAGDMLTLTLE